MHPVVHHRHGDAFTLVVWPNRIDVDVLACAARELVGVFQVPLAAGKLVLKAGGFAGANVHKALVNDVFAGPDGVFSGAPIARDLDVVRAGFEFVFNAEAYGSRKILDVIELSYQNADVVQQLAIRIDVSAVPCRPDPHVGRLADGDAEIVFVGCGAYVAASRIAERQGLRVGCTTAGLRRFVCIDRIWPIASALEAAHLEVIRAPGKGTTNKEIPRTRQQEPVVV